MSKSCLSFILVSLSILASSCLDTDRNLYVKLTNEQYFDFNLNKEVALTIDYGFATKDKDGYVVLFELYDQNPLETTENGMQKKEGIEPVYRAATDGSGKYTGKVELLSDLSEVWLYCDYPGAATAVKLEIKDQSLSFDQKAYIAALSAKTRALTPNNKHKYPDKWLTLGDWDEYGRPDYLLPEQATPPPATLYSIKDIYNSTPVGGKFIMERYPQFFDGTMTSDIKIVKPTKIRLAFITSSASWNNVVGYFTYETNNPPTSPNEIQKIVAFPNASPVVKSETSRGALSCNDQIQLMYWDKDKNKFDETFPAGVSIGWFLEGMGFNLPGGGNIEEKPSSARYSIIELNDINKTTGKKQQYTVSLRDKSSSQIVAVGFEDNSDMKFNDACFYVGIEEPNAIDPDTPVLPEVTPPQDIQNTVSYNGMLTFEDLWPKTGDYDMNDLMLYYKSTVYRTIVGNRVYKVVDEITPFHDGGNRSTGFGYQLSSLDASSIKKVTIEGGTPSTHMQGMMLEPGQSHPTILVFDDIKGVVDKKFTITIEMNGEVPEDLARPPYNPFIFNYGNRGIEVHLPKYTPTSKADMSLFGTEGDGSRPEEKLYYVVSRWLPQMPFAINLPGVKDFPIPNESERISDTYPGFTPWVSSAGKTNGDWYKKPKQK